MNRRYRRLTAVFVLTAFIIPSLISQPQRVLGAGELRLALKRLTVLGSVLYVAAHPDDENTAFLATMVNGRQYRAAYLAMTRGEGGQNLLGPEQGDLMGVIRTQELLAARRIDGAEQFFTRAIDFGYSKTSEETLRIWGKENILSDVVWIIRTYRPDVVVTRFTPTLGGHGNHTSSAILAEEAFRLSGDPNRFPEQLKYVQPWQPKRLVWNGFRFQQSDHPGTPEHSVSIDLGGYSTLLGKSYSEIAGESRSMHKSQGFGAGQNRGEFINYFQHVAGDTARQDLFDGINTTWSRIPGAEIVGKFLDEAYRTFDDEHPARSIPTLLKAYNELSTLSGDPWIDVKKAELLEVVKSCAGLWVDALASEPSAIPGGELRVAVTAINRSDYPFVLERVHIAVGPADTVFHSALGNNVLTRWNCAVRIPADMEYTQPFWLREKSEAGSYVIRDQRLIGQPENSRALVVTLTLGTPEGRVELETPVRYRLVDPVEGEIYRPFDIIPPVTVSLSEHVFVFPDMKEKSVDLTVKSGTNGLNGSLRLNVPPGWTVKPDVREFDLKEKNEEQTVNFLLKPANGATSGRFTVEARVQGEAFNREMVVISYKHIPLQTVFPVEEGKLLRIDVVKAGQNIGYIMGAGDEIPAALRQVGYSVTLISDEELAEGNLGKYDAIVAGVRAYNTRPKLKAAQKALMEFVKEGGSYIVQYTTLQRGESENLGPYPFNVSHDRVTVEDAPIRFVDPKNPLLNVPNKIGEDDFKGWVQERGLYFADKWDSRYTTVLSSNDPEETPKEGGLLMTKYGNGYYFYSAYAFFRQLPAGVPGAYRLLSNMVSIGKTEIKRKKNQE